MSYQVLLKRSAEKELDALPASIRDRIVERLLNLEEDPRPVGVTTLQGQASYRLRVGMARAATVRPGPCESKMPTTLTD